VSRISTGELLLSRPRTSHELRTKVVIEGRRRFSLAQTPLVVLFPPQNVERHPPDDREVLIVSQRVVYEVTGAA